MNKYDKLIDAISDLDADLVAEHLKLKADLNRITEINKNKEETKAQKKSAYTWRRWTLAAACLCLAVIMVAALLPKLWTDPTPPTPSGSDIFYNENGELDENLIFANLSQVVWDTSVTSPEEEKPLGKICEWNGLRLEEELYNKLITAGENDLFAVRLIYDGTKLYERQSAYYKMLDAQAKLDSLKTEAERLEASYDGNDEVLGKELNAVYSDISEMEKQVAENKKLADNGVLTECHDLIRVCGIKASHPIDEYVVMFASKKILNTFSQKIDDEYDKINSSERNPKEGFIFTLAPNYLAEEFSQIVDPPAGGDYDPNEKNKFAYTKLKFYSTETEFSANLDVIREIKKCYNYYDDLTFAVTYSGKIPAEKLEAMKYSDIEQSADGTTVTVTVNCADFDSDALKNLSRDTNVWRIFVSYPEGAEMGFAKDKIYFGWPAYDWDKIYDPVTGTSSGEEMVNDRETILKKIDILMGYDHPKSDDILVAFGVKGTDMDRFETVLKRGINLDYYSMNYDSNFNTMVLHIKREGLNIDEFVKAIQNLSYDKEVGKILVSLPMIKSSE